MCIRTPEDGLTSSPRIFGACGKVNMSLYEKSSQNVSKSVWW